MPHDAFISYSTHDKATADATCARLEAAGIRCWIAPRDITPGREWSAAIVDAIGQCRVMILVFSESANRSPQIHREVERAVNKGISVLPLRIEDIAPARSLEYFIGTVHWLDALTPPLESHLRRLVEAVKALLQIEQDPAPLLPPPPPPPPRNLLPLTIALAAATVALVGIGAWLLTSRQQVAAVPAPEPAAPKAAQAAPAPSPIAPARTEVDPAVVGTLEHTAVIDDYQWRFVDVIRTDGSFRLVITQEEDGAFQAGNGRYLTTATKTGRVRSGSYRAIDGNGIEVAGANGAVIFRPDQPGTPINPANPVMLGLWRATFVQGGLSWTAAVQNNSNGTYHYEARAEESGVCSYADQRWHCTSTVTGRSDGGTYRVIDAGSIEITGANGTGIWQHR
jgi:TIR domain-containing protein